MRSSSSTELLFKYQMALEHASMGVWQIDFNTQMMSWDEGIRKLYDISEGIYEGHFDQMLFKIHPEDRLRIENEIEDARLDISDINTLFRYSISTEKNKYIRTNAIKLRDSQNKVIGLIGLNWDITIEYHLKEDLNKTKVFLEKVVDGIPDPVFIKDNNRVNIFANVAYEKLVGLKKIDFIGKKDQEFLPKEVADSCDVLDTEAFSKNTTVEKEEKILNAEDNLYRDILTKKTVFKLNDNENILVGVIRDITDIKNIQNSLIEQSKMASLGEMAAEIAHEINNPLTIIQAKSQILLEKIDSQKNAIDLTKCINDLRSIELNSIRIDKIIKSLKAISRQSAEDPLEDVSIKKIIEEAIEISFERFQSHSVKLIFNFEKHIDYNYLVKVRSAEIIQVLVNLLNNSFDAVHNSINPWVEINLSEFGLLFKIEVVDSGVKIEKEVVVKMMEPFFTTKASGSGTGLGLSISKQIIKNHEGQLFYDTQSSNTKFVFMLKKT